MLILNESEIIKALSMKEALEVNKEAFIQLAAETAVVPTRIQIATKEYEGSTLFKPARVKGDLGLKVVSVRPQNAKINLPTVPGYIFLVEEVTGTALALMDATYLTALRTAAGSALATDYLAKKNAAVLTVFGAGLQATVHIDAILSVRESISIVWLWNRTKENAVKLQETMSSKYPKISFKVAEDTKECVENADIIVTATNSQTPVFDGKYLKKGVHINAVGSYRPTTQELDAYTVVNAKIVLDTMEAVEAGDLHVPINEKLMDKSSICGQVGDLFSNNITVRSNADEITLFKSVGTAVQDIATAGAVVRNAKKLGLGSTVDF